LQLLNLSGLPAAAQKKHEREHAEKAPCRDLKDGEHGSHLRLPGEFSRDQCHGMRVGRRVEISTVVEPAAPQYAQPGATG